MSRFGLYRGYQNKSFAETKSEYKEHDMAVAYVEIDGVPGESTNAAHPNWIEIQDLTHSLQQKGSQSAGSGAMVQGKASGSPYSFWKKVD